MSLFDGETPAAHHNPEFRFSILNDYVTSTNLTFLGAMGCISNTVTSYNDVDNSTLHCRTWNTLYFCTV